MRPSVWAYACVLVNTCERACTREFFEVPTQTVTAGRSEECRVLFRNIVNTEAASGGETSVGESRLGAAYALAGAASVASWTVCAFTALGTHPYLDLPVRHNLLTIAQALCFPVPVFISVFAALSAAATKGGKTRLKSATYRRLNLGLFASSMCGTHPRPQSLHMCSIVFQVGGRGGAGAGGVFL